MRVFKQSFTKPSGVSGKSKKWYVEFRDHDGRALRLPGFVDRAATQELGRQLERLVASRAVGAGVDAATAKWLEQLPRETRARLAKHGLLEAHQYAAGRPIADLVAEFEASLAAKGVTKHQVKQVAARVRRVLDACQVRRWSDLTALKVERALHVMRSRAAKPLSVQTSNHLLGAVRQFCRWAIDNRLASEDPLRLLRKLNVRGSTRRNRRALTKDELVRLLAAAEQGAVHAGVPGTTRALIYRLAVETGLRRAELASLRVGDLTLAGDSPTVSLHAKHTKNRRDAVLPLRTGTARRLAEHVRERMVTARVFDLPKFWRAAEMLEADLRAAGIDATDEDGHVVDFHSLRHTFASILARNNVPPRVAQSLMRHSDPRLTLGLYAHLGADDERKALDVLPNLDPARASVALRSTGTDARDGAYRPAYRPTAPDGAGQGLSMPLFEAVWRTRQDSNLQPSVPKTDALSN